MSRFLTLAEIIEIHREMLRRFGGASGIRDAVALDAAVGRPQSGYYRDVIAEAAALFESLSQNHPFFDGNKRTALAATAVFLLLNGVRLQFDDSEAYEWLIASYTSRTLTRDNLEQWLRSHARSI